MVLSGDRAACDRAVELADGDPEAVTPVHLEPGDPPLLVLGLFGPRAVAAAAEATMPLSSVQALARHQNQRTIQVRPAPLAKVSRNFQAAAPITVVTWPGPMTPCRPMSPNRC